MSQTENHVHSSTCCLCLSDDESTFHLNSILKSLPLHEMVNFCIGIQVSYAETLKIGRMNFEIFSQYFSTPVDKR